MMIKLPKPDFSKTAEDNKSKWALLPHFIFGFSLATWVMHLKIPVMWAEIICYFVQPDEHGRETIYGFVGGAFGVSFIWAGIYLSKRIFISLDRYGRYSWVFKTIFLCTVFFLTAIFASKP